MNFLITLNHSENQSWSFMLVNPLTLYLWWFLWNFYVNVVWCYALSLHLSDCLQVETSSFMQRAATTASFMSWLRLWCVPSQRTASRKLRTSMAGHTRREETFLASSMVREGAKLGLPSVEITSFEWTFESLNSFQWMNTLPSCFAPSFFSSLYFWLFLSYAPIARFIYQLQLPLTGFSCC